MALAKITLLGLEQHENFYNRSLFSNFKLPSKIDKDILVNNILINLGEFEVLYSDVEFLRYAIQSFFSKYYVTFDRWQRTLTEDYNPIHNYDRYEKWTDKGENLSESNGSTSTKGTTGDNLHSNGATEITVSAFDSNDYQPKEKTKNTNDSSNLTTLNSDQINSDTIKGTSEGSHIGHLYGNIGVTTSAQMVSEEISLRKRLNIYQLIEDLFARELLVLVYD